MKQKYVIPTIEYVGTFLETAILAGSTKPSGGGSSGQGEGNPTNPDPPTDPINPDGPTDTSSKGYNFNAWESWDEY